MGKNWSQDWSARDRFLTEEFAKFMSGLPAVDGLTDHELRVERERLAEVYSACLSKEAVAKGQPITALVTTRTEAVMAEIAARAESKRDERAERNYEIDREALAVSRRANWLAILAIAIALFSVGLQLRGAK